MKFGAKINLNQHVASVHEGIKPFKCEVCDCNCSWKGQLNQMKKRSHSNVKFVNTAFQLRMTSINLLLQFMEDIRLPFKCLVCERSFSNKSDLNQHVATVHEGNKPFKCKVCEHSFSKKSSLKRHNALFCQKKLAEKVLITIHSTYMTTISL